VRDLTLALAAEGRLVGALGDALRHQRAAVAADQPEAVEASVAEISRLLLALRDARRDRARLLSDALGPGPGVDALHQVLGTVPPELVRAQADLHRVAVEVAQEAAINRGILRRVIESGEAFLQQLFSSASPASPAYLPRRDEPAGPTSVLFNLEA